jgi:hypothetical protein
MLTHIEDEQENEENWWIGIKRGCPDDMSPQEKIVYEDELELNDVNVKIKKCCANCGLNRNIGKSYAKPNCDYPYCGRKKTNWVMRNSE